MTSTHAEALAIIKPKKPGSILAGIRLADNYNGIGAVNEFLRSAHRIPVVFITAYPASLVTGLLPEPIFLISKPFETDVVCEAVSHAQFLNDNLYPGVSPTEQTRRLALI